MLEVEQIPLTTERKCVLERLKGEGHSRNVSGYDIVAFACWMKNQPAHCTFHGHLHRMTGGHCFYLGCDTSYCIC